MNLDKPNANISFVTWLENEKNYFEERSSCDNSCVWIYFLWSFEGLATVEMFQ